MSSPKHIAQPRLDEPFGVFIDRGKPLTFTFEGAQIHAVEGDSIASALINSNQWLMSRSFKYHRPRGPLTMAGQDANTLVQLKSAPNTLADRTLVSQGVTVQGQNYTGSLENDKQSLTGLVARFLPVGFYYKTFFRPRGIWELWAKFFRSQAGLGQIDQDYLPPTDPANYFDKQYKFADVAIIGAGPAGMSAALEAAALGADVILIEENSQLGGSLNYARFGASNEQAQEKLADLEAAITAEPKIEVLLNTCCNSWHADNWLAVVAKTRLYKLRAKQVVLAAGSLEQQAIFRGNDTPGVMMSSAAQRLMRLYAVQPGNKAVVLTANDEGYATALDLIEAGVVVAAVVEMRASSNDTVLSRAVAAHNIPIHLNSTVYEAIGDKKGHQLARVEVRKIIAQGVCGAEFQVIDCDVLTMSVGYMPTYQLACQAGAQLSYDDDSCLFSLSNYPENFHLAGSVNGRWSLAAVQQEGALIGARAASIEGYGQIQSTAEIVDDSANGINHAWPMFSHPKGKEFVDFDEDLQIKDIVNATKDGYEHIQLVKRYSTCGMGPSQGRHSALAAARLVANATNKTVAETGVTTARPPFASEQLGLNAGRSFYPARRSNMHYRHIEAGAQMMLAGDWYRPAYYGAELNRTAAIEAEVLNVRNNVGLVDVSTLGGIEVRGTEASEFLNRFYTFSFTKQQVGKARYALLTNEAGVVIDDGVSCRFHVDHFYVTATTGGVDRVFQSMLKWNTQWGLNVDISNATTAWCGVNIAGPNARKVLSKVCSDVQLSSEAFPYMSVREGTVAQIPARLIRVGFVGELGYEIHVPQQYGEALWDALMAAGVHEGIKPFGVEAQRLLRLEKGHVIIGQDTDAMSNPMELKMNWALSKKKPFHLGSRSIRQLKERGLERILVGFYIDYKRAPLPRECQLVVDENNQMIGRVTSVSHSPSLNKTIGLAYVPPSKAKPDTIIIIKTDKGRLVKAVVADHAFYDPDNLRQEPEKRSSPLIDNGVAELSELAIERNTPLRRGPLNRIHEELGASFKERSGALLVNRYQRSAIEIENAKQLGIVDLSSLNRLGFKGRDTVKWLEESGCELPQMANTAISSQEICVAALSDNEFIVLDSIGKISNKLKSLGSNWARDIPQHTYILERADSHAWFALSGEHVPEMLSKVCAVDMRLHKFDNLQVAQTSVARSNSIVIRADQGETCCFYVLCDLSAAEFMWACLLDAMQEFAGKPIGYAAFKSLSA